MNFFLPSSEQWKYAYMGGNQSKGYTYSGSNNPGDVAWYAANASSKQKVKTKAPNELGIYDMSGNVSEFTSTTYKSGSYTCATYYGGNYTSDEAHLKATNYYYFGSYNYTSTSVKGAHIGFRLMLTCE